MGGSRRSDTDRPVNLVLLCGSGSSGCHLRVGERAIAEHLGYYVPQTGDPATTPIWIARVGWVLLNDDGSYTPTTDPDPEATRVLELAAAVLLDTVEERTS